jgi:predicted transcriptional regulator
MKLRSQRNTLGISQSKLARLSGVSRFKICTFELGTGLLSEEEYDRIRQAFVGEAHRLRNLLNSIEGLESGGR